MTRGILESYFWKTFLTKLESKKTPLIFSPGSSPQVAMSSLLNCLLLSSITAASQPPLPLPHSSARDVHIQIMHTHTLSSHCQCLLLCFCYSIRSKIHSKTVFQQKLRNRVEKCQKFPNSKPAIEIFMKRYRHQGKGNYIQSIIYF